MLLLIGCGGTALRVRVESKAARLPIAAASVLMYDVDDDPCHDSPSGGQSTNTAGLANVTAHYCGRAKLHVCAKGFEPIARVLDTCAAQEIAITLKAARQPAAHGGGAGADQAALTFIEAVLSSNLATLRVLLLDPNTAETYLSGGLHDTGQPYAMRVVSVTSQQLTTVDTELLHETGCRIIWRCTLTLDDSTWRIVDMNPAQ
jgi:hypothetical protein